MKGRVVILSGPVNSGKSTALMAWVRGKAVEGFLTPTVEGRKVFYDIGSGRYHPYELLRPNKDSVAVGRFILDGAAFAMARKIASERSLGRAKWIVIDEIGLLELQGGGHHQLFEEVLQRSDVTVLVVVRSGLVDAVMEKYGVSDPVILEIANLYQLP